MQLSIDQKDINKFLMIGDKVLIKPKNPQSQTKTGLYLPPSVQEKEKIQSGYVIKTGPGYALPAQEQDLEVWEKKNKDEVIFLHLIYTSVRMRCVTFLYRQRKVIWQYICKAHRMKLHSMMRNI